MLFNHSSLRARTILYLCLLCPFYLGQKLENTSQNPIHVHYQLYQIKFLSLAQSSHLVHLPLLSTLTHYFQNRITACSQKIYSSLNVCSCSPFDECPSPDPVSYPINPCTPPGLERTIETYL